MSGVFQNTKILTPQPLTARCGGRTHSLSGEGVGGGEGHHLEDARQSSVLYICKYFVLYTLVVLLLLSWENTHHLSAMDSSPSLFLMGFSPSESVF